MTHSKKFLLAAILSFVAGCQTTRKVIEVELPQNIRALFASCGGHDGALNMQVFADEGLKGAGELEWISDIARGWKSELMSPIGQSLLQVDYDATAKRFSRGGPLASSIPEFSVDEDGFIEIDGYFIGIKPMELACFARFTMPSEWQNYLVKVDTEGEKWRLTFADNEREIKVETFARYAAKIIDLSLTIEWRRFLGLIPTRLKFKFDYANPNRAELSGLDHFSLKWIDIDGR